MKNTDRLILGNGDNCIFNSDSNETGINNNIVVIGSSGCGKTVSHGYWKHLPNL